MEELFYVWICNITIIKYYEIPYNIIRCSIGELLNVSLEMINKNIGI